MRVAYVSGYWGRPLLTRPTIALPVIITLGSFLVSISTEPLIPSSESPLAAEDLRNIEDIGYMTCMTLVMLGNYAQTGHFGGPLA